MRVIKKWLFKPEVDHEKCIFCNFTFDNDELHYQDQNFYVITDISKASAQEHLLVITKKHIDNALKVQDPQIIRKMQQIGEKILSDICDKKGIDKKFRFGFHLPPWNSIDHLHLHCFIQPLSSWRFDKVHYGMVFNSIEDILAKLEKNVQI